MLQLSRPHIDDKAIAAVVDVLRSGQLVHGDECLAFESELAAFLKCNEVVVVSSGTAALHLSLLAFDIGPGDAVIVPDFTFPATANVVTAVGAKPIVVDVLPGTYTINPEHLAETIRTWRGPDTLRAVIPVHEFGCPAAMEEILEIAESRGLMIIEDAACALGATIGNQKVGTMGHLGCFSFHPRKTLTTGEGGAIATNQPELAKRLRLLRNHGMERQARGMTFCGFGLNYRLTNFQAALGRHQLPELNSWIERRRKMASLYIQLLKPLSDHKWITTPLYVDGHSWQTFMVVLAEQYDRNDVIQSMNKQGIETNLGAQSISTITRISDNKCRVGKNLYTSGLALPLYEQLENKDLHFVAEILRNTITKSMKMID